MLQTKMLSQPHKCTRTNVHDIAFVFYVNRDYQTPVHALFMRSFHNQPSSIIHSIKHYYQKSTTIMLENIQKVIRGLLWCLQKEQQI